MRISDWSSDVCSSDLIAYGDRAIIDQGRPRMKAERKYVAFALAFKAPQPAPESVAQCRVESRVVEPREFGRAIGRATPDYSVQGVAVRVRQHRQGAL